MNPNLAALLFFSPFLIMFFSFMFWIFREEKRRERLRKKWNEEWKEEVRELEEIERRTSMKINREGILKWCDSVEKEFQPREEVPRGEVPKVIQEQFLATSIRYLRALCDEEKP